MLAGEPPFTGPTAQAIIARRLTETPRPLRGARDGVAVSSSAVDPGRSPGPPPIGSPTRRRVAGRCTARHSPDGRRAHHQEAGPTSGRRTVAAAVAAVGDALCRSGRAVRFRPRPVAAPPSPTRSWRWRRSTCSTRRWRSGARAWWISCPATSTARDRSARSRRPRSSAAGGAGPTQNPRPELGRTDGRGRSRCSAGCFARGGTRSEWGHPATMSARGRPIDQWETSRSQGQGSVDRAADSLTFRPAPRARAHPPDRGRAAGDASGSTRLPALKAFLQGEQHPSGEWDSALWPLRARYRPRQRVRPALQRAGNVLGWPPRPGATPSLRPSPPGRRAQPRLGAPRQPPVAGATRCLASLFEAGPLANHADSAWASRLRRVVRHRGGGYRRAIPMIRRSWFLAGRGSGSLWAVRGAPVRARCSRRSTGRSRSTLRSRPAYIHPIESAAPDGPAAVRRYLRRLPGARSEGGRGRRRPPDSVAARLGRNRRGRAPARRANVECQRCSTPISCCLVWPTARSLAWRLCGWSRRGRRAARRRSPPAPASTGRSRGMLMSRGHLREAYPWLRARGHDVALRRRRADRRGATGQRRGGPAATAPGARLPAAGRGLPLVGRPARHRAPLAAAAVRADSAAQHGADPAARVVGQVRGRVGRGISGARASGHGRRAPATPRPRLGRLSGLLSRPVHSRGAARRAWPRRGRVGHSSGGPPERHAQPVSDGCALGTAARACGGAAWRPCDRAALLRLGRRGCGSTPTLSCSHTRARLASGSSGSRRSRGDRSC